MTSYFKIQFQLFRRELLARAISPRLIVLIVIFGFVPFSNYLFKTYAIAGWLYIAMPFVLLVQLSAQKRTKFYKSIFNADRYRQIRLTENLLLCAPFAIYLAINGYYLQAIITIILSIALVFISYRKPINVALPTPFKANSFEFIRGFRRTFFLHLFGYALAFAAIYSKNPNLGIAGILISILTCMGYFYYREPSFFIWINVAPADQFLYNKIIMSCVYAILLVLPSFTILAFGFLNYFDVFLFVLFLGLAFLSAVILAKYTSFPNEITIPNSILIMCCIPLPPLILIVLYILNKKAIANINSLVND